MTDSERWKEPVGGKGGAGGGGGPCLPGTRLGPHHLGQHLHLELLMSREASFLTVQLPRGSSSVTPSRTLSHSLPSRISRRMSYLLQVHSSQGRQTFILETSAGKLCSLNAAT